MMTLHTLLRQELLVLALEQDWEVEENPESEGSPGFRKYLEKHLLCSSKEGEEHFAAQYELQMCAWLELRLHEWSWSMWPYF